MIHREINSLISFNLYLKFRHISNLKIGLKVGMSESKLKKCPEGCYISQVFLCSDFTYCCTILYRFLPYSSFLLSVCAMIKEKRACSCATQSLLRDSLSRCSVQDLFSLIVYLPSFLHSVVTESSTRSPGLIKFFI